MCEQAALLEASKAGEMGNGALLGSATAEDGTSKVSQGRGDAQVGATHCARCIHCAQEHCSDVCESMHLLGVC